MIIGGIQKNSLIDFPAKICCVIFTAGCNFDCPYCHNPELVKPPYTPINPEEIFAFLNKRKSLLDGVAITGGEPTLQKDLPEFCEQIKSIGIPIKIDTNGSRPKVIEFLLKNRLIDYIAMDVKTLPENYSPHIAQNILPADILQSIQLIKNSDIPHEFRTTCVKPFINEDIIYKIARIIKDADLFVLQKANIQNTVLHPDCFENQDSTFSADEIESFKKIVMPYVKKAMIR
jgi:pyruvate formate lyase activating enzyme